MQFSRGKVRVRYRMKGVDIYGGFSILLWIPDYVNAKFVVLCVITLPTTPNRPSSPQASCVLFGLALSRFVQPRKLLAQYLLRASWLLQNSLKYIGLYVLFSVYVPFVPR